MDDKELKGLFDKINRTLETNENNEEHTFNRLYKILSKAFGNKLYFCKTQGKRWAFLAGEDQMITPEQQTQLTERYGILYDNPSDTKGWNEALNYLKQQLS